MSELNEVIHQPVRLRIMAALDALRSDESVDFAFLRNLLDLTDGNLGAHLRKLEEAGYVHLDKTFVDRKPRTYVAFTAKGRHAFQDHVDALKSILQGSS
jgi:DNA-binding MarR family transcriptional regulator